MGHVLKKSDLENGREYYVCLNRKTLEWQVWSIDAGGTIPEEAISPNKVDLLSIAKYFPGFELQSILVPERMSVDIMAKIFDRDSIFYKALLKYHESNLKGGSIPIDLKPGRFEEE